MLHCRERPANLNPDSKRNLPSLHRYSQYCRLDCQIHPVIREEVVRNLDLVAECSWQMHVTLIQYFSRALLDDSQSRMTN